MEVQAARQELLERSKGIGDAVADEDYTARNPEQLQEDPTVCLGQCIGKNPANELRKILWRQWAGQALLELPLRRGHGPAKASKQRDAVQNAALDLTTCRALSGTTSPST